MARLDVTQQDRTCLVHWSQHDPSAGMRMRASIVLLASLGFSASAIARQLDTTRQTVVTWTDRYRDEGVTGLRDRARPGRRRALCGVEVVLRTLLTRPYGRPYGTWSSRLLAAELGVSNGTIATVWRRWGLRPADPQIGRAHV